MMKKRLLTIFLIFSLSFSTFAGWNTGGWYEFENDTNLNGLPTKIANGVTYPVNNSSNTKYWFLPDRDGSGNYKYYQFTDDGYVVDKKDDNGQYFSSFSPNSPFTSKIDGAYKISNTGSILDNLGKVFQKVFSGGGSGDASTNTPVFVGIVEKVKDAYNGVWYNQEGSVTIKAITNDTGSFVADCSGFVSACLWTFGINIQGKKASDFDTTANSGSNAGRITCYPGCQGLLARVGFTETPATDIKSLRPGAILIKSSNSSDAKDGHTIIYLGKQAGFMNFVKSLFTGEKYNFIHMSNREKTPGTAAFESGLTVVSNGVKLASPPAGIGIGENSKTYVYSIAYNPPAGY